MNHISLFTMPEFFQFQNMELTLKVTGLQTQASAGLLAHHAYETVGQGRLDSPAASSDSSSGTPLTRILSNGVGELANRLNEAVATWEQVHYLLHFLLLHVQMSHP